MNLTIRELNELIYSLGIAGIYGSFTNKELSNSLHSKLHDELARKIEVSEMLGFEPEWHDVDVDVPNYIDEEVEDEGPEFDGAGFSVKDRNPHFVSNEEADEDYRSTLQQDAQRYADKKDRFNGVSQAILNFVEKNGVVSFSEMNDYYKQYTKGSNSFSHILKALRVPYKNRPTRRFLVKRTDGNYRIDYATQYNWVVNDVYDYND